MWASAHPNQRIFNIQFKKTNPRCFYTCLKCNFLEKKYSKQVCNSIKIGLKLKNKSTKNRNSEPDFFSSSSSIDSLKQYYKTVEKFAIKTTNHLNELESAIIPKWKNNQPQYVFPFHKMNIWPTFTYTITFPHNRVRWLDYKEITHKIKRNAISQFPLIFK